MYDFLDKIGLKTALDALKSVIDSKYSDKIKYADTTINVGRKAGTVVGVYSTAEGSNTTASGGVSHAEGVSTTASGYYSHAEGVKTTASGDYSHAEGDSTRASGYASHAGGSHTTALHKSEVAYGLYNESNDDTLFSIGDGTAEDARHNAFEITTTGGKLHDKDIATIDDIPTSLPANGGNADYSDNSGAINGRLWREINSGLLSDITESGMYDVHQVIDDAPVPQHGLLIAEYNVGTPMQIFFPDSIGSFYKRNKYGDAWSDWSEFFESKSIKSMRFPGVTTNADGWQSLEITTADYNIIGYQCNTNDHRVELYKGSGSTTWYAYGIQQYPNPGIVAADTVLDITIFYI